MKARLPGRELLASSRCCAKLKRSPGGVMAVGFDMWCSKLTIRLAAELDMNYCACMHDNWNENHVKHYIACNP